MAFLSRHAWLTLVLAVLPTGDAAVLPVGDAAGPTLVAPSSLVAPSALLHDSAATVSAATVAWNANILKKTCLLPALLFALCLVAGEGVPRSCSCCLLFADLSTDCFVDGLSLRCSGCCALEAATSGAATRAQRSCAASGLTRAAPPAPFHPQ